VSYAVFAGQCKDYETSRADAYHRLGESESRQSRQRHPPVPKLIGGSSLVPDVVITMSDKDIDLQASSFTIADKSIWLLFVNLTTEGLRGVLP
jgi:hypothetical protein